jgi:hypothetical protein
LNTSSKRSDRSAAFTHSTSVQLVPEVADGQHNLQQQQAAAAAAIHYVAFYYLLHTRSAKGAIERLNISSKSCFPFAD